MEHVDGGDLQAYLVKQGGSLSVDVARFLFQQLVLAVRTQGVAGGGWEQVFPWSTRHNSTEALA